MALLRTRSLVGTEELDVAARGVKGESPFVKVGRGGKVDLERQQPEQMKVELGDVVTAQFTTQLAEVGRVKELIERTVNQRRTAGGLELRPTSRRCLGDKPLQLGRLGIEPVTG